MSLTLDMAVMYDGTTMIEPTHDSAIPLRECDDIALVSMANTGDTSAFEELVRRYRNEVFAFCYHFVRNREEAWDLSQEAFIKAYKALKRFRGKSKFKTWLMRITANHCKDWLKKRRLKTVPFDDVVQHTAPSTATGPRKAMENSELGKAIEYAVSQLSPKHQLAFVLREYEDMSYAEMSDIMECNLGTVMSRLHHARKKLQNTLIAMGVVEGN